MLGEPGVGSRESGAGSREPGARSREPGVKNQGARRLLRPQDCL